MERALEGFDPYYSDRIDPSKPRTVIEDKRFKAVLEAKITFSRRLQIVQLFLDAIKGKKILEGIIGEKGQIKEDRSIKPYNLITTDSYPYHVQDYEVLPIYSEVTTTVVRSVHDLTINQLISQHLQLGIRVETPLELIADGGIQVVAGFLDLPTSQIRKTYVRRDHSNIQAMDELREVVKDKLRSIYPPKKP